MRIFLNSTQPGSEGVKNLIINHYPSLKMMNPSMQILIRDKADDNFEAVIEADYGKGINSTVNVNFMTEREVMELLKRFQKDGADLGLDHNEPIQDVLPHRLVDPN
ncbi:hypothetical protein T484DRAFT_1933301 [Baffinella frigidus]|nr:hypothetical protein T484DRAFT_1933301 [Cryptophyta sp. CCMP2293]